MMMTAMKTEEFSRRREAILRSLRAHDTRRAIFTSAESIYYLTGASYEPLERPFFLQVDVERTGYELLVPLLEQRHLGKAWGVQPEAIHTYREYPAPAGEGWAERLADMLAVPFVFEPATPHAMALGFAQAGGRPLELLEAIRIVKSPWEISQVERAAAYADWGVMRLLRASYFGSTVAEGALAARGLLTKAIKEVPDFDYMASKFTAASWPAPLSAEPHAIPSVGLRHERGPHVALVLTRVNGYAAECERTFFTAPPTAQERERFELMRAARQVALDMVRPGVACGEIDAAVNRFLGAKGWDAAARLHRVGHGFGLGNHEPPWLAEGSTDVLAQDMLVSIEPGLYEAGVGGYRHSDTFLVTRDGARSLTRTGDTLAELTLGEGSVLQRLKGAVVRKALRLD